MLLDPGHVTQKTSLEYGPVIANNRGDISRSLGRGIRDQVMASATDFVAVARLPQQLGAELQR